MAAAPTYAATPVAWCGLVPASADTSFTAPSAVTVLGSAGSSGTKISQIDVLPVATTVAGVVNLFIYDGTAYHLLDSATIGAWTVSTTAGATAFKQSFYYDNLVLPSSSWSLRCSVTVAGDVSILTVSAFGASL